MMSEHRKNPDPPTRFVSATVYCRLAGLPISGRTLQNACRSNPHLAERLGQLRLPGRTLYDGSTASAFARLWLSAQHELRAATPTFRAADPRESRPSGDLS